MTKGGLYPSRSELIRCAVREFLIEELESAKDWKNYQPIPMIDKQPSMPNDFISFYHKLKQ
ncbi:ribbon-helix-helix domain-containing protein [Candidatus Lokiarchaeum ossiferum]|uniref:ribbon-helix-helix domain-containing protein n=1 Tax=Candidatus Lokiarchaeum ossiferum TaxID=2951803 RepID=UPI00352EA381